MSRWLSRGSTRLKRFPSSPDRGGFRSGLAVRRNRNKSRNSSFLDWLDRLRKEKDCQHHQMTGSDPAINGDRLVEELGYTPILVVERLRWIMERREG